MRGDPGYILYHGAAAVERHQPILSILEHAMGGGEHEVGCNCDPRAQAVPAHDEYDVPGDGRIRERGAPDHGADGSRRERKRRERGERTRSCAVPDAPLCRCAQTFIAAADAGGPFPSFEKTFARLHYGYAGAMLPRARRD